MKPTEALDLHADLKLKISDPKYSETMAYHLAYDLSKSLPMQADRLLATSRSYVDDAKYAIGGAETFFVSADMCDLVAHAASVLDSSDVADMKFAPSKQGFVYFEKPIELIDIRGSKLLLNAVLWHPVTSPFGHALHLWNDEYRYPDDAAAYRHIEETNADFLRCIGRWGYIGTADYQHDKSIGDAESLPSEQIAEAYLKDGVEVSPMTNATRVVHALWLMMMQKLTAVSRMRGDKRLLRRMSWAGLPGEVTVIQLRHVEYEPREGESLVQWKHRWVVRGYWRWQQYKNEEGNWDRKRIWIDPYIKGPADAPLKVSRKVNALVR